jgi:hypothetical protein
MLSFCDAVPKHAAPSGRWLAEALGSKYLSTFHPPDNCYLSSIATALSGQIFRTTQ